VQRFHAEYGRCDSYREGDRGWVPEDRATNADGRRVRSPSSHSLEFSLNDHAAAVVARGLGRTAEAERWARRSRGWEQLYRADLEADGKRGFVAGRTAGGLWTSGLFCEGSTWDYTFMLPHAVPRLVALSGGREAFVAKLMTGLARGRMALDNEPATLAARLFAWAGRPDLVAYWSRRTLSEEYGPEGYPGPDDGGAMSSWYVWTALGLFPVIGSDLYVLNGPLFPRADVRLPGERVLTIVGEGAAMPAPYVQSVTWNGVPLTRCWLRHGEIAAGGALAFVMGEQPSRWAADGPAPGGDAVTTTPAGGCERSPRPGIDRGQVGRTRREQ
jgi:putative alpha-1,2-mannosidase